MKNNQRKEQLLTFLKDAMHAFFGMALIWLLALFLIRIVEILLNGITHQYPEDLWKLSAWAVLIDFIFWTKWLFWEFLIFAAVYFYNRKLAKIIYGVFIVVMAVTQLILVQYFNTSLVLLGADLYGYSLADIKQTVGASGGIAILPIIGILIFLGLLFVGFKFISKKINIPFAVCLALITFSFAFSITNFADEIKPKSLSSDFANNLLIDKSDHFFRSSYSHFFPESIEVDIYSDNYSGDFEGQPLKLAEFKYVDEANYPFLHQKNASDVLSPFFNLSKTKPNIVILLVEGLGRAFTNEGAYLGNFTPYISTISKEGLYWKNFLSEGGRTFAVLPSLTASLPFSKNGFIDMGKNMPNHLSLFSLLKFNGYHTSFYYGGDASFDNMKLFLQQNKVDEINDGSSFPKGATKLPSQNGFSWGYTDNALFSHFLNTRKPEQENNAQLSVILTVATHDPFLVDDENKYLQKFENRMTELSFDEAQKKIYRNYKLQYASILYTDDAIQRFMEAYKKRPDFENTIFLITGDHRMPEIPMSTKIDRYHVPLIIYSPLIKRPATFASISTHFDIVPSLLSYLENTYKIKTPSLVSWMGDGLDTTRAFQNRHSYPIMQTKTDLIDYVLDVYHLNGNSLFQINADMGEVSSDDNNMKSRLQNAFDTFKRKNNKIINGGKIIPDSIYLKYSPPKN